MLDKWKLKTSRFPLPEVRKVEETFYISKNFVKRIKKVKFERK